MADKVYHVPDWGEGTKSMSKTAFAICGQDTSGPQMTHWFPWKNVAVTCEKCIELNRE